MRSERCALVLLLMVQVACGPVLDQATLPNNTWLEATPLVFSRQNLPGVVLGDRIFLLGGVGAPFSDWTVLSDVSAYNPNTGAWVDVAPMP